MACWIFVINDDDKVFEKRMSEKKWPIFIHTHNRRNLRINDNIIFYKAGKDGQKFLGTANLS